MWFATTQGLFRYDTRNFKAYLPNRHQPGSIASHYIQDVMCDSRGDVWVSTWGGLSRYDQETDSFTNFCSGQDTLSPIGSDIVFGALEDRDGNIWAGTSNGVSRLRSTANGGMDIMHFPLDEFGGQTRKVRAIAEGSDGMLWLATYDGLVRMSRDGREKKRFKPEPESRALPVDEFLAVYADQQGTIWLGSSRQGLIRFDIATERFRTTPDLKTRDGNLPNVSRIVPGRDGALWVATLSGLACFDPENGESRWFDHQPGNPYSLHDNWLYALFSDRQGGLWTGGYYLGISYMYPGASAFAVREMSDDSAPGWLGKNRKGQLWGVSGDRTRIALFGKQMDPFTFYDLNLSSPITYNSFYLDDNEVLWCGGNSVLTAVDLKTRQHTDYIVNEAKNNMPRHADILCLYEDSKRRFWVGGAFGLSLFSKESGSFQRVGLDGGSASSGTPGPFVRMITEDSRGNLWVGGKNEVFLRKAGAGMFERLTLNLPEESGERGLVWSVWNIAEDVSGRIWFAGVRDGLRWYDPVRQQIFGSTRGDGRENDYVFDIQPDRSGYLWISGDSKLIRYHPGKGSRQYYDEENGLPVRSIIKASVKGDDGTLYFSTTRGMFWFRPSEMTIDSLPSPVALTSLKLFNSEVRVGDDSKLLPKAPGNKSRIVFSHRQNVFTLEFALLSFVRSDRNTYAYRLEGFDRDWNYVRAPSATYTSLPPGEYRFRAKAANSDGYWNHEPLELDIVILPPWWKTWYAYAGYGLLLGALIYLITRFFWLRSSFRKENELYQAKLDFFTNVSHEIRTHLTLIGSPLEKAFYSPRADDEVKGYLKYAKSNSDRLMGLVNELLDFRKIQAGYTRLEVTGQDLVRIIRNVLPAFEHLAEEKGITTRFDHPDGPVEAWIDAGQVQKVFYNLLSNAYKFTQEGGEVSVTLKETGGEIVTEVWNSGKSIAPAHLPNLFTNFFQVYEGDTVNTGYGIGLALSRSIVDQHHGGLSVRSGPEAGTGKESTCFILRLQKGYLHFDASLLKAASLPAAVPRGEGRDTAESDSGERKKCSLLLIEDNDELRAFAKECFRDRYDVLEADNGAEGFSKARECMPDIVICDVMLPGISGLEVCRRLKSDLQTSHIPVIMLSARGNASQVTEGLEAGADDYLIKPFDLRVLELKISNLIEAKKVLRHHYSQSLLLEPDGAGIRDPNAEFLEKLKELVLEHLSDTDFGVEQMAYETGLSISVLYRKLRSLTGMTVNEFTKTIRMKRAVQLLESGSFNVSEVALMVGFESSRYFGREFRKIYGIPPSEIRKKS